MSAVVLLTHRQMEPRQRDRGTEDHQTEGQRDRGPPDRGTEDHQTEGLRDRGPPDRGTEDHQTEGQRTTRQRDRGPPDRGTEDRGTEDHQTEDRGTEDHQTGGQRTTRQRDRGPPDRGTEDPQTEGQRTPEGEAPDRGTTTQLLTALKFHLPKPRQHHQRLRVILQRNTRKARLFYGSVRVAYCGGAEGPRGPEEGRGTRPETGRRLKTEVRGVIPTGRGPYRAWFLQGVIPADPSGLGHNIQTWTLLVDPSGLGYNIQTRVSACRPIKLLYLAPHTQSEPTELLLPAVQRRSAQGAGGIKLFSRPHGEHQYALEVLSPPSPNGASPMSAEGPNGSPPVVPDRTVLRPCYQTVLRPWYQTEWLSACGTRRNGSPDGGDHRASSL
ncbi:unnamed protein product [Gadus morhua 'NCC']